jgi:hypothetical protein
MSNAALEGSSPSSRGSSQELLNLAAEDGLAGSPGTVKKLPFHTFVSGAAFALAAMATFNLLFRQWYTTALVLAGVAAALCCLRKLAAAPTPRSGRGLKPGWLTVTPECQVSGGSRELHELWDFDTKMIGHGPGCDFETHRRRSLETFSTRVDEALFASDFANSALLDPAGVELLPTPCSSRSFASLGTPDWLEDRMSNCAVEGSASSYTSSIASRFSYGSKEDSRSGRSSWDEPPNFRIQPFDSSGLEDEDSFDSSCSDLSPDSVARSLIREFGENHITESRALLSGSREIFGNSQASPETVNWINDAAASIIAQPTSAARRSAFSEKRRQWNALQTQKSVFLAKKVVGLFLADRGRATRNPVEIGRKVLDVMDWQSRIQQDLLGLCIVSRHSWVSGAPLPDHAVLALLSCLAERPPAARVGRVWGPDESIADLDVIANVRDEVIDAEPRLKSMNENFLIIMASRLVGLLGIPSTCNFAGVVQDIIMSMSDDPQANDDATLDDLIDFNRRVTDDDEVDETVSLELDHVDEQLFFSDILIDAEVDETQDHVDLFFIS